MFLIVSIKHTKNHDKMVTFWQKNSAGYCYTLELAGRYSQIEVYNNRDYFTNHVSTIAVHIDELENLFVDLPEGHLEGPGKGLENTKTNWDFINDNGVEPQSQYETTEENQPGDERRYRHDQVHGGDE